MDHKDIIGVKEAGEMLMISPQTVRNKCKRGLLPATKNPGGRDWLINKKEIEKILP